MAPLARPYYEDAWATIYHGEALDVLRQMDDATIDAVVTDPPYSSGGMFRSDRNGDAAVKYRGWSHTDTSTRSPTAEYGTFGGDNRDSRSFAAWVGAWAFQALRITRASGSLFCFSDWRQIPTATDAVQMGGWMWRGLVVWDKGVGRPMKGRFRNHLEYVVWATNGRLIEGDEDRYPSTLISVPTVNASEREHVTQKPVELLRSLLAVVPFASPLAVLDPFMGSGTTLVAAKYAGHRAVGIEIEERYCEIAAKRLGQEVFDLG